MPDNGKKKNWNPSIQLMKNRMWDYTSREEYEKNAGNTNWTMASEGLPQQSRILLANGGFNQQDRMIFDKARSLDRALMYSYQGANIQKVPDGDTEFPIVRGLINPNKLKQDYDDKILSVHNKDNFKPGDVFKWINTDTYWLIYLQDLTELAYFRGDIRKCSYQINWVDEDGEHSTYAAIRGPVETKIDYIQKHLISVDNPNYSLSILMPRTEAAVKYFKRYAKFYLQDEVPVESQICWRVEATDWISTPGILEVIAVEYYSNKDEDDIENGLAGKLALKAPEVIDVNALITGEGFIKPRVEYIYKFVGYKMPGDWTVDKKLPIKLTVDKENPREVKLKWISSYSGQFDLTLGENKKTIVVESLF